MRSSAILLPLSSALLFGLSAATAHAQQAELGASASVSAPPPAWGYSPQPAPAAPPPPQFGASYEAQGPQAPAYAAPSPEDREREERKESLKEQNTVSGTSGLLRTRSAGSGAAGTFRVSILADWFQSKDFLCNGATPCPGLTLTEQITDKTSHFGATLGLSVTATDFLEAYGSFRSYANSNDRGRPELLQVLGDTTLGVKAFTPKRRNQPFSFGGSAELLLLNGTGGLGVDGSGTGARFTAIASADLRESQLDFPMRFHFNFGYHLDNSGKLVEEVEARRGDRPITRIERYGLGINRVDHFEIAIGTEATFEHVRPFAEYSIGVPVNRQGYTCNPGTIFAGDACMGNVSGVGYLPSTLTLGARAFPGWVEGLHGMAAFDIGLTGTKKFLEETAPTAPWTLWLGVGYAFDTAAPPVVQVREVERVVTTAPPQLLVRGFVHEAGSAEGIPNAIVRYQGRDLTAMATGPDGRFVTQSLEPGQYTFSVEAEGYKPGVCTATVMAPVPPMAPGAPQQPPMGYPPAPPQPTNLPTYFEADCALEALPRVGNLYGKVLDAETNQGVAEAKIRLVDARGKELQITTDAGGGFRFDGVDPGTATLRIEADGYLLHQQTADIRVREDRNVEPLLRKRPAKANVEVAAREIRIKQQINFETNSAKIAASSTPLLVEIADVIVRHPHIKRIEVQGHTDNSGTAEHNMLLSEQRAAAVRDWLIQYGVEASRLTSKGYGQTKPLGSNRTAAGRAKNRRVQFMILEQEGAPATAAKPATRPTPAPKPTPKPTPLPF